MSLFVRLVEISSSFGCRVGYYALQPVGPRCLGREILDLIVSLAPSYTLFSDQLLTVVAPLSHPVGGLQTPTRL